MGVARRLKLWPMAAALALALPTPAVGQAFAIDDPAYAHLYSLEQAAETLQEEGPQDAPGKRAIITEWEKLREAALAALPDGSPHPLAWLSDIKIGSQLYALGENLAGMERSQRGVEGLAPYIASYPLAYAEAVALNAVVMAQGGEAEAALPLVRAGHAQFEAYYETLATADRTRGVVVSKSNLEFALSQVLARLGEVDESLRWQQASLDTRRAGLGESDTDTVASWYGLSQALLRAERTEDAEAAARKAVELAIGNADPSHPSHARALEMLGIVLSRTGRPIEATGYLTEALALKRVNEGTDNTNFAYGVHNLGSILFYRDRYEDAEPLLLEADQSFRSAQGDNSPFAAGSIAFVGQIAYAQGRPDQAIELMQRAERQLGDNQRDELVVLRLAPDLIAALAATGQLAEARARAERHAEFVASIGDTPFALANAALLQDYVALLDGAASPDGPVASAETLLKIVASEQAARTAGALPVDRRAAIELAMDIAVRTDRPELMLRAMRLINASSIALASKRRRERLEAGDAALAEALRRLQDAAGAFETAEGTYLAALAKGDPTAAQDAGRAEALARLDAARADLRARYPEWSESGTLADGGIAELAASLAPGEAILAVAPVHRSGFLLLVTPERTVALKAAPSRAEMVALAQRLGGSVRGGGFDQAASRALHEAIFPSAVTAALQGVETLRIQAGGALASLPFSVLQAAGANDEPGWLIDRFALVSLSDLAPRRALAGTRKDPRFLAVAAPVPFGSVGEAAAAPATEIAHFYRGGAIDATALGQLPPLAQSRVEAETIASFFGAERSRLLLGAEASEAGLRGASLHDASIVLFATHGLISGEMEGVAEPSLVLSPPDAASSGDDGLLTASEIAALDLDAELVILSACNSAAGGLAGLPAFTGLAQAFRQAGADLLMVSHWPVRDDVAAYLSIEALKAYRAGLSRPQALREAMRKLRAERSIDAADEPFAWAPFVLLD